jgi:hypothetical protein
MPNERQPLRTSAWEGSFIRPCGGHVDTQIRSAGEAVSYVLRSYLYKVSTDRHWTSPFSAWDRAQGKGSDVRTQPETIKTNSAPTVIPQLAIGARRANGPRSPCQNPAIQACNGRVMRLVNWGRYCGRRILLRAEYAGLLRWAEPASLDDFRECPEARGMLGTIPGRMVSTGRYGTGRVGRKKQNNKVKVNLLLV